MRIVLEVLSDLSRRPVIVAIAGAQGSGKSTLARKVENRCQEAGISAAILSLDDLYMTRAERQRLAKQVHPLFATRGPPGTHDIELGLELINRLQAGDAVGLPRFDKAHDDRCPPSDWPLAPAECEVLIFEGWCVGAAPEDDAALIAPVNALEAEEDPRGIWRRYVNDALAGAYRKLFSRIDRLVYLAAPGFEVVERWRAEQERGLLRQSGGDAPQIMGEAQLKRFVQHYERLTRHMLEVMPAFADCTVYLDDKRMPVSIDFRPDRQPDR